MYGLVNQCSASSGAKGMLVITAYLSFADLKTRSSNSSRGMAALAMLAPHACAAALTYFTCRHSYEPSLIEELQRDPANRFRTVTSPAAAVVRADDSPSALPSRPDPTYALQYLPDAVEIRQSSIKALSVAAYEALALSPELETARRGSLEVHCLVPDLLRGVPSSKAKLLRRCENVAGMLTSSLRGRFACARPAAAAEDDSPASTVLLLQLLLLEPELLVVSVAQCVAAEGSLGRWPSPLPAGLAQTDLPGDMPSSAYRKLLEAWGCLEAQPPSGARCVDLGACPGG